MFIINTLEDEKIIKVAIPLTGGTGKTRVKTRNTLNEYGLPFSSRSTPFNKECYIEWQIGYDVVKSDIKKADLTKIRNKSFIGANKKEKLPYELSEYISFFYNWGVISKEYLLDIKDFLNNLDESKFICNIPSLSIKRTPFLEADINGFNLHSTKLDYPVLISDYNDSEIIAEIIVKEKQNAIGTQPMLYLCFPITELENGKSLLGRIANKKEFGTFIVNSENIFIFTDVLKIFGSLSPAHNQDIISIIDLILKGDNNG